VLGNAFLLFTAAWVLTVSARVLKLACAGSNS
jgi:hypothetical protein